MTTNNKPQAGWEDVRGSTVCYTFSSSTDASNFVTRMGRYADMIVTRIAKKGEPHSTVTEDFSSVAVLVPKGDCTLDTVKTLAKDNMRFEINYAWSG